MDTSRIWNTPAMAMESALMDRRVWHCTRPGCNGKVDPDGPDALFCSRSCTNWGLAHGGEGDRYNVAMHRERVMKSTVARIRPRPLDSGLWPRSL